MDAREEMKTYRRAARIVGALFLTAMFTYLFGATLIDSTLTAPDYLGLASANSTLIVSGVLLEFVNILAVIAIAVMMFPILRRFSESLAMGYVVFRTMESAVLVAALFSPILILALANQPADALTADAAQLQSMGAVVMTARAQLVAFMTTVFFSSGALLFYYALYQTRLVPRFISAWGLIAVVLVFAWNLLDAVGISINAAIVFGLPIILNEIFLGFWLIIKGFDFAASKEQGRMVAMEDGRAGGQPA